MRRYLVVAHQTLGSPELLDAMRQRVEQGPCAFHLVVPQYHLGGGMTWTEGRIKAIATRRLQEGLARFQAEGFDVTGEVGSDQPVESVETVLHRDGADTYAEIIVSTLPLSVSKWFKLDVPSRLQRKTTVPVLHVAGHETNVTV